MDEQRKWILEMESPPPDVAVKTAEMRKRDLEHHINLTKQQQGLRGLIPIVQRSSPVDKMLPNDITCSREITHEKKG